MTVERQWCDGVCVITMTTESALSIEWLWHYDYNIILIFFFYIWLNCIYRLLHMSVMPQSLKLHSTLQLWFIQWQLLSSPAIPASLLPNVWHSSSFFFPPFSDWSNICSSWAPACLFSGVCFQQWLNSAVSDFSVFGLARLGDGGWAGSGALSAPATLAALLSPGLTGPVSLTHCSHSVTEHTQDRVWIVWRPVAMPGMLSLSSSLGKKGIWFSVSLTLTLPAFEKLKQSDERDH